MIAKLFNLSKKYHKGKHNDIKLRAVREDDCDDLWIWRNHPKVREWSYNTYEIEYEKHKEWFRDKIISKGTRIYVAENRKGEKIGQIRFELEKGNRALVNVNLNPEFFGKGFGSEIIKRGSEPLIRENKEVREIVAEILDGNIVSKKAF